MNFFIRKERALLIAMVAILAVLTVSCSKKGGGDESSSEKKSEHESVSEEPGKFTDEEPDKLTDKRDGQKYRTVKIGNQTWMAENLNHETGNSWCYNNDDSNCKQYGRLYDWKTAWQVCPDGWHLPSRREWGDLAKAAGGTGDYGNGGTAGAKLKSASGWDNEGNGTDGFSFSALPGGSRAANGSSGNAGNRSLWWTASEFDRDSAYYRRMGNNYAYVYEGNFGKGTGFSVRCVEGAEAEEGAFGPGANGEFTDERDGKTYKTVKIGGKMWMGENLNHQASSGSWCYWNNNSNCDKYGRLYDWKTAMEVCPVGWHLPTKAEWSVLVEMAGGEGVADRTFMSKTGWDVGTGTDDYGFSALPGGGRNTAGRFVLAGSTGNWWTATARGSGSAYPQYMGYVDGGLIEDYFDVGVGFSVRCVGD